MTSIELTVTGPVASARVSGVLTAGMVGVPVTIICDSAWDGLIKTLVCQSSAGKRLVLDVKRDAVVAPEVLQLCKFGTNVLYIGLEGRKPDGTLVITSTLARVGAILPGAIAEGDPAVTPENPAWVNVVTSLRALSNQLAELEAAMEEASGLPEGGAAGQVLAKKSGLDRDTQWVDPPENGKDGAQGPIGLTGPQGPKGDKGDAGPAGAAGKTPIKGEDYWTESDKQEILDGLEAAIAGVPGYWKAALDTGIQAINTALCAAGANKSAFLFYSDTHWNYGAQKSPVLLNYLCQHTGMVKTFFGGDIVNNEGTDYDTMEYLWDWRHQLKVLPNHHSVVGNHDDGNATNNIFPEAYIYGYLLAPEETPDIVREKKGLWYYMDSPAEMTRYLFLDTAYQGATEKQLTFVKAALLSTPKNWHIVAVSHIWYDVDYGRYNERPVPIKGLNADASKIIDQLDSYNSRTGGYASCKGWVEFCIGGHCHQDYDGTTTTGIPIILVETDSQHIRSALSYTAGTTTEAAVNGIVADYDNHKIEVIRVGRGESRTVKIESHPVSYTNVLAKALAADGVSVYNGVGYKENVRWSQSGQSEGAQQGNFLTGWIPVRQNDIVRLKNVVLSADSSNFLLYSAAPGSTSGSLNGTQFASSLSPVWDTDGNLIQFTFDSTAGYFRLSCKGIGETSVITINEAIG